MRILAAAQIRGKKRKLQSAPIRVRRNAKKEIRVNPPLSAILGNNASRYANPR